MNQMTYILTAEYGRNFIIHGKEKLTKVQIHFLKILKT